MNLAQEKRRLVAMVRQLADEYPFDLMPESHAVLLAFNCAALADNARRRCEARSDAIHEELHSEHVHRYGETWVRENAQTIRTGANIRISKDAVFKAAASENEMYGRWANMYSQLAMARSSIAIRDALHSMLDENAFSVEEL